MQNVKLQMVDVFTGNQVERTICGSNAMKSGQSCWELGDNQSQKTSLQNWINQHGNQQHDTMLDLISWSFC